MRREMQINLYLNRLERARKFCSNDFSPFFGAKVLSSLREDVRRLIPEGS